MDALYLTFILSLKLFHFLCTQDGFFSLFCASQKGYIEIVDLLLQRGATVNLQTKVGIATAPNVRCKPEHLIPYPPIKVSVFSWYVGIQRISSDVLIIFHHVHIK